MQARSAFILLSAFLCAVPPAHAQGQQQQQPVKLPEGNGREIVQVLCSQCHSLNMVANSGGYTEEGWKHVIGSMIRLRSEQAPIVTAYLAKNFPERPMPQAVLIPGPANVTIKEWLVPTLGSRPHDPAFAPDGSIWWTGQYANVLGRLDPKTGALREYLLKTPESGPHGLISDKTGNIWYTGVSKRHIGKLDPISGEVTEYPMPDTAARGPHTPIFDQKGTLWFTLQSGMGRKGSARDGRGEGRKNADREHLSLWYCGELQGRSLVCRFPRQSGRQHRPRDDADSGIPSARYGRASATDRHYAR